MIQTKRDYALSEAKWLAESPADWRPFRLKEVAKVSPPFSGNGPDVSEDCSVIPMEVATEKGTFNDYDVQAYDLITPGLTNFENGDVIFAKITPCMENGKGAFVEGLKTKYAFGSTEFHVFRPNTLIDGKFLYYYTYDPEYRKYAAENMTGAAGQKRVSTRFVEYTPVFLPIFSEQRFISSYLDKQCAAIDKVIDSKREQLEILETLRKSIIHKAVTKGLNDSVEFKGSGINWIGKIPKTWNIERLKDVIPRIYGGATPDSSEPDYWLNGDIVWITPSDFQAFSDKRYIGDSERKITQLGLDSCATQLFPVGTVLMTSRASIGEAKISKCQLCTNQGFISFICDNFSNRFLAYVIDAYLGDYFNAIAPGTTFKEIGRTAVKNEYIAFPDINTQESISDYLDKRCKELKQLRINLKSQIETLLSYRNSLIHECVIGKRRITEDVLKELANV